MKNPYQHKPSMAGASLIELLLAVAMMIVAAAAVSSQFATTARDANRATRASTTAFQDLMLFHRQIQVAMTKQRRDEYLAGKPTLNFLRYPGCNGDGCIWKSGEPDEASSLNQPSENHRRMVFEEFQTTGNVKRTEYYSECSSASGVPPKIKDMASRMPVAVARMQKHCMPSCSYANGEMPVIVKKVWDSWDDANDDEFDEDPAGATYSCIPQRLYTYNSDLGKCVPELEPHIAIGKQTLGASFCAWAPVSFALGNVVSVRTWAFTQGGNKRVRILSNYSDASLGTLGSEISIMTD